MPAFTHFLILGADPADPPWWLLTGGLAGAATLFWGLVRLARREVAVGLTIAGVSLVAFVILLLGTIAALVDSVGS